MNHTGESEPMQSIEDGQYADIINNGREMQSMSRGQTTPCVDSWRSETSVLPRPSEMPSPLSTLYEEEDLEESSEEEDVEISDSEPQSTSGISGKSLELDFEVEEILGKRIDRGLAYYVVRWKPSKVLSSDIHQDEHGGFSVKIGGGTWGDVRSVRQVDCNYSQVQWEDGERTTWRLSRSVDAIARWYAKNPEEDIRGVLAQPRFWMVSRCFTAPGYDTPAITTVKLPRDRFVPEDMDLTLPLLNRCLRDHEHGRLKPSMIRMLNIPLRRPLRFSPEFLEDEKEVNIGRPTTYRALMAYCIGKSKLECSSCKSGKGPFLECVCEDYDFSGACVGCAVRGGGCEIQCEHHHSQRSFERPEGGPLATVTVNDPNIQQQRDDDGQQRQSYDSDDREELAYGDDMRGASTPSTNDDYATPPTQMPGSSPATLDHEYLTSPTQPSSPSPVRFPNQGSGVVIKGPCNDVANPAKEASRPGNIQSYSRDPTEDLYTSTPRATPSRPRRPLPYAADVRKSRSSTEDDADISTQDLSRTMEDMFRDIDRRMPHMATPAVSLAFRPSPTHGTPGESGQRMMRGSSSENNLVVQVKSTSKNVEPVIDEEPSSGSGSSRSRLLKRKSTSVDNEPVPKKESTSEQECSDPNPTPNANPEEGRRKRARQSPQVKIEPEILRRDHPHCIPGEPCLDPVVGRESYAKGPVLVYNDRRFRAYEATQEEVRYILSQCTCYNVELLHDAVQVASELELAERGVSPGMLGYSLEDELAGRFSTQLNNAIYLSCPTRNAPAPAPFVPGEMIDLTLDD